MKNNKGFTLIELLAVIVILAIIALIASPIIIGLIDDARKEAAASSGYGVLKAAENVFAKALIKSNGDGLSQYLIYTFSASSVTINASTDGTTVGNAITDNATAAAELGTGMTYAAVTLDFNGTKPSAGTITIDKTGNATVGAAGLTINNYDCDYADNIFTCQ